MLVVVLLATANRLTTRRVVAGYCETTTWDEGDCSSGQKGSWQADKHGISSLNECAIRCLRCARCRFVSYSSQQNDCGWFQRCPGFHQAPGLETLPQGFGMLTARVEGTTESTWRVTPLTVPLHVANLIDGELSDLPQGDAPILIEIGSSDRNTLDVELLPRLPDAFLVTAEPLVDKYARALSRRVTAKQARDTFEPLGRHHERGLVLPIAIGPAPSDGRTAVFNAVGGCSSLLSVQRNASFGSWCFGVREQRRVRVFPLSVLLSWVPAAAHASHSLCTSHVCLSPRYCSRG